MVLGKKVTIFYRNGAKIRPLEMGRKGPDIIKTDISSLLP